MGDGPRPEDAGGLYDQELGKLYGQFSDQVYRVVRRDIAHEDAEEIVNSAFLAARRHWARVRTFDYPVGYVIRTAQNLRADVIRHRAARRTVSLEDLSSLPSLAVPGVEADDDVRALRAALSQLSPRQEQVVVLYYWTGLPAKEIAEALGMSPGHIGRTLSDARARLHRLLSLPLDEEGHGRREG